MTAISEDHNDLDISIFTTLVNNGASGQFIQDQLTLGLIEYIIGYTELKSYSKRVAAGEPVLLSTATGTVVDIIIDLTKNKKNWRESQVLSFRELGKIYVLQRKPSRKILSHSPTRVIFVSRWERRLC